MVYTKTRQSLPYFKSYLSGPEAFSYQKLKQANYSSVHLNTGLVILYEQQKYKTLLITNGPAYRLPTMK